MTATRSVAGRQAKAQGASWESAVEALLSLSARQGVLTWWRTPEPMRRIRPLGGGQWACVATGKGPPDYVVLAGGVAIAAEAKSTTMRRWRLQDLQEHQALALDRWQAQGGVGVVFLLHGGKRWVLPWSRLGLVWWRWFDGKVARGEASLGPDEITHLGMAMDPEGGWLTKLKEEVSDD